MEIEIPKNLSGKIPKPRLAKLIAKKVIEADLCSSYYWSCGMLPYIPDNQPQEYAIYINRWDGSGTRPMQNMLIIPNVYRFPFFRTTPLIIPTQMGTEKAARLTAINEIIQQTVKEYLEEQDGNRDN